MPMQGGADQFYNPYNLHFVRWRWDPFTLIAIFFLLPQSIVHKSPFLEFITFCSHPLTHAVYNQIHIHTKKICRRKTAILSCSLALPLYYIKSFWNVVCVLHWGYRRVFHKEGDFFFFSDLSTTDNVPQLQYFH